MIAFMSLVVLGAAAWFLRTPKGELIHLEPSREFSETAPVSSDVTWTRREAPEATNPVESVWLRNGPLSGELFANGRELENPSSTPSLSGFRSFRHARFPERDIFQFDFAGLNFEHLLWGGAKDRDFGIYAGNFAPRKEPSTLSVLSESSAALFWAAANSRRGVSSQMTFTMDKESHVDLEFRTALQTPSDADYLIYMWASYMQRVKTPAIHFWGVTDFARTWPGRGYGTVGWVRVEGKEEDDRTDEDQGIIHFLGTPKLPVQWGVPVLNYRDYDSRTFLLPFFFGVVDGDGDLSTTQDDMVYIMMFDRAEHIRFVVWDFSHGDGRPVWDWQYVLRKPEPARTYGYRARLVYKPYAGQDDVVAEYLKWTKSLGESRHQLQIDIVPPESAALFPAESRGMYGDKVHVYFGVNPSEGWVFDHWEGNVTYKKRRFTGVEMNGDETVRAICRREKQDG